MSEQFETGPASLWKLNTINPNKPTMRTIAERVAAKHKLRVADLTGPERSRKYAWPRQEAMYEMQQIGRSTPQIGEFLGGRDHTTVLHGISQHKKRMAG